jgi:hypothetical protein
VRDPKDRLGCPAALARQKGRRETASSFSPRVCGVTSGFPCGAYIVLMAQISPWHSIRQRDRNVYHDDDQCPIGKAIDSKYRKLGHRCRMRCKACAKLGAPEATSRRLALLEPL